MLLNYMQPALLSLVGRELVLSSNAVLGQGATCSSTCCFALTTCLEQASIPAVKAPACAEQGSVLLLGGLPCFYRLPRGMGARVGGLEGLRCASLEPVLSRDVCVAACGRGSWWRASSTEGLSVLEHCSAAACSRLPFPSEVPVDTGGSLC